MDRVWSRLRIGRPGPRRTISAASTMRSSASRRPRQGARIIASNASERRRVMARAYNIIDADGHVLEPFSLWEEYMDPAFRERRPRMVIDDNGKERLGVEGKLLGNPRGIGSLGAVGVRQGAVKPDTLKYAEGKKGGFDPHARILDMDADGIDAAFLYPSLGLFAGAVADPWLAGSMCRAYNRWLADYCKPYPDRLFGVAMLPLQSVELAIDEMRFAKKELGFHAGFIRPNPYSDKMIHEARYEPFWAAAEGLDFAIGFHEGASSGMPTVGVDRFEGRGARHIISHTMEMMLAAMRVSEIFQRNCWIWFEPVEGSIKVLADYIGPHKILWATDYPHPDGFFPGAPKMIEERMQGLSPQTRHQIMAGGAMGFYGLN